MDVCKQWAETKKAPKVAVIFQLANMITQHYSLGASASAV